MNIYDALILKALGGGGGTTVVANPEGEATEELEKLQVGSDIYEIPKDYAELDNKPQINGETLSGNKTASELGLQAELDGTQTVSGNPITVTDAEAMNAESVVVELEPKQDLHGYDAPWVGGSGKNLFEVTATTQTINGITFTVNSDGTVIANGTATAEADFLMSASNIQGSYIVNGCPIGGSTSTYYLAIETSGSSWNNRDLGNGVTINDDTIIRAAIVIVDGYTANNLIFKPMIRLASETDPTFAPYSNICPISGYSEVNVERVGKNLLDINASGIEQNAMFNTQTLEIVGSENYDISDYIEVKEGVTYKYSRVADSLSVPCGVFYDKDKNPISFKGNIFEMTIPSGIKYVRLELLKVATNQQLEVGSSKTTYEPYQGNTYTIDLDGTRYGGTLDVTEGGYSDEWGFDTLDGTETWNLQNNSRVSTYDVSDNMPDSTTSENLICSAFRTRTPNDTWFGVYGISCQDDGTVSIGGITDVSEFTTWLSNNPIQIAYRKKTPSSVSTTPTNITLLENTNNISTDGTNITLKYQPNNVIGECKAYTDEQIEKHNPLNYSTDEKAVGTWIDGKTIWQKTIEFDSPIQINNDYGTDITTYFTDIYDSIGTFVSALSIGGAGNSCLPLYIQKYNNKIEVWRTINITVTIENLTIQYTKN